MCGPLYVLPLQVPRQPSFSMGPDGAGEEKTVRGQGRMPDPPVVQIPCLVKGVGPGWHAVLHRLFFPLFRSVS